MKQTALIALFALFATFLPSPSRVNAAEFNMNMVITDSEFTNPNSMSTSKIQQFLELKGGVLKDYFENVDGMRSSAADIIHNAAVEYSISPKVILVIIQKESSMLTRTSFKASCSYPTDHGTVWPCSGSKEYFLEWVTFAGWCEDTSKCFYGSSYLEKFRGFKNQIYKTAQLFRYYLGNVERCGMTLFAYSCYGFGPGITRSLSDCISIINGSCAAYEYYDVTPMNAATAALYTYTPHKASAYSFWSRWNDYGFNTRLNFPNGTIARIKGTNDIYLIQNGVKRKFASTSAFRSRFSTTTPIVVNSDQLFFYEDGKQIKFANYSLLVAPKNRGGNGRIYLLVNDTLRHITSPEVFRNAGFQMSEVVKVYPDELKDYDIGVSVTSESLYPSGRLLQYKGKRGDPKNGMVYFVQDGVKHGIPSKGVLRSQFGKRKSIPASPTTLERFTEGDVLGFKDGTLVSLKRGQPVYFISNGQRLHITSMDAMRAYGFDKLPIVYTNQRSLDVHPIGPKLTGEPIPPPATP